MKLTLLFLISIFLLSSCSNVKWNDSEDVLKNYISSYHKSKRYAYVKYASAAAKRYSGFDEFKSLSTDYIENDYIISINKYSSDSYPDNILLEIKYKYKQFDRQVYSMVREGNKWKIISFENPIRELKLEYLKEDISSSALDIALLNAGVNPSGMSHSKATQWCEEFEHYVKLDPYSIDANYELLSMYREFKFDDEINKFFNSKRFVKVLSRVSDAHKFYEYRVNIHFRKKEYYEAKSFLDTISVRLDDKDFNKEISLIYCDVAEKTNKYKRSSYKKALEFNNDNAIAYFELGKSYEYSNQKISNSYYQNMIKCSTEKWDDNTNAFESYIDHSLNRLKNNYKLLKQQSHLIINNIDICMSKIRDKSGVEEYDTWNTELKKHKKRYKYH